MFGSECVSDVVGERDGRVRAFHISQERRWVLEGKAGDARGGWGLASVLCSAMLGSALWWTFSTDTGKLADVTHTLFIPS